MIKYTRGNLLDSDAEALVNTVNTMGVMGKGIALQFKETFPHNYKQYVDACNKKELAPGKLLVTKEISISGEKWIINFPTKTVWYRKSSYKYVEDGLIALAHLIDEQRIQSIAVPPLGCGNGGLEWTKVKLLIEKWLSNLSADIQVFEPNPSIKSELRGSATSKTVKLTSARAMLLHALMQYEKSGESSSLFVANKLAYILQRSGESLNLKFIPHHYGPYSEQIRHVLYDMNGVYLNGLEQKTVRPFEPLQLNYSRRNEIETFVTTKLKPEQLNRLKNLEVLVHGFESAFALELLTSVDYLMLDNPSATSEAILNMLKNWSNRKDQLFKKEHVELAYLRLKTHQHTVFERGLG